MADVLGGTVEDYVEMVAAMPNESVENLIESVLLQSISQPPQKEEKTTKKRSDIKLEKKRSGC